jgi:alkanesulfonate monooxygenase SsuD/methylene tetrahydromethanopterin reductase-like flavin-dependent oxidoreductase (luciferase family)
VIAGVNVIAADTASTARQQFQAIRRTRAASLLGRQPGTPDTGLTDEQADELLASGGAFVDRMLTYTAAGTPVEVRDYLDGFIKQTEADELMTVHNALTPEARLHSVTLLAEAMQYSTTEIAKSQVASTARGRGR